MGAGRAEKFIALPSLPPTSKRAKSIKLNESSGNFTEIKGSHFKKPRDFEWRGRDYVRM